MRTTRRQWAALVAAGGLALTGCAAGSSSDSSGTAQRDSTPSSGEGRNAQPESAATQGAADQSKGSDNTSSSGYKAPTDAHIARTVSLSLTVEDLDQASAKVRSTARKVGGYVSQEDSRTATHEGGRSWAEITVTVPVDELDSATSDLTEIGEVTKRASSAEDLTAQYTDTAARVRTKTRAVERLRTLIDSTEDLDQIVTLEDELATREADLESMTRQHKALQKRTATAPITISLTTESTEVDLSQEEEAGFVAGLGQGWSAFTSALTVGLTALGALTPFVLTGLVLLSPLAWWLRRRGRHARPEVESPPSIAG